MLPKSLMPSRVLFNDLVARRRRSGIGNYAAELLEHFPGPDRDVVICPWTETVWGLPLQAASSGLARVAERGLGAGGGSGAWRRAAGSLAGWIAPRAVESYFALAASSRRFSLYHEPDTLALPFPGPIVATVHDLSVSLHPDWHPDHRKRKFDRLLARSLARTTRFISVSDSTREEMVKHWGVPVDRITVIPLAPRRGFRPVPKDMAIRAKAKHGLPEKYLLYVGNLEPRKNIEGLLRAYAGLPRSLKHEVPLVLIGAWAWRVDSLRAALESPDIKGFVRHLGFVADDDLVSLLGGAVALVYPSHYEGFGLPVLEAMACGTPVIASDLSVLKEVGGDAAIYCPRGDDAGLRSILRERLESDDWRPPASEKSLLQASKFSWEKTAARTAQVYASLLRV